jgi:hypothetical protein
MYEAASDCIDTRTSAGLLVISCKLLEDELD